MTDFDDILNCFRISETEKCNIRDKFILSFEESLNAETVPEISTVKMLPTYISKFPDKKFSGNFVSVDLGGTNVRVVRITIGKNNEITTEFVSGVIPEILKSGEGEDLFDFVAEVLEIGIKGLECDLDEIKNIGFTFSFPCNQEALNHGVLVQWGKLYRSKDVVGKNVVELFLKSCKKRGLNIENFFLLNDATGTFLAGSFEERDTFIAVLNGTGINACYLEKTANVKKINKKSYNLEDVIVNTECGLIGDTGSLSNILTKYDKILDQKSINPGKQIFEKCVSGLQLPELARIIIVNEYNRLGINKSLIDVLSEEYSLNGEFLSFVKSLEDFKEFFKGQFNYEISKNDYEVCYKICECLISRASILFALILSILVEKCERNSLTVAVDGTMFTKHPNFLSKISQELKKMTNKNVKFKIVRDGSGKGSALAACLASISNES